MSEEQGHTPGPYWLHHESGELQIKGRNGAVLFRYPAAQEALADAHLWKLTRKHTAAEKALRDAAPCLLEALEAMVHARVVRDGDVIDRAKALLAQHEGSAS